MSPRPEVERVDRRTAAGPRGRRRRREASDARRGAGRLHPGRRWVGQRAARLWRTDHRRLPAVSGRIQGAAGGPPGRRLSRARPSRRSPRMSCAPNWKRKAPMTAMADGSRPRDGTKANARAAHRFHRRSGDPRLPGRADTPGASPSGSRGGAGGGSGQPSLCHGHAEHAGVDDAQYRPVCAGFRARSDGAVRSCNRTPSERRTGERDGYQVFDSVRLHAGRRQRRSDGPALGEADSRDAERARMRRRHSGRRSGRYPDGPGVGEAGHPGP